MLPEPHQSLNTRSREIAILIYVDSVIPRYEVECTHFVKGEKYRQGNQAAKQEWGAQKKVTRRTLQHAGIIGRF
jgi:hypothetical protein